METINILPYVEELYGDSYYEHFNIKPLIERIQEEHPEFEPQYILEHCLYQLCEPSEERDGYFSHNPYDEEEFMEVYNKDNMYFRYLPPCINKMNCKYDCVSMDGERCEEDE